MAHDYEDLHNIESLDDAELRELVREELAAHPGLEHRDLNVHAHEGKLKITGRVGTEGERRIAAHIVTDVLGIVDFSDEMIVDALVRIENSSAADEHADDDSGRGALLSDESLLYTDESAHLAGDGDAELGGTADYQKVMEEGMSWNPPTGPTPEGLSGSDGDSSHRGENH